MSSKNHLCTVKNDILILFGLKIKALRLEKKWSQEILAEKTGFHRTYIGMIERGERNLSLKNIAVFAQAFSISISKLLEL
jgi:transcriptional regulator with XRE-family HTH domain